MGNLSYEEGPKDEGLRRGTVGEPGGRSWSGLEVKSGTESLEGVLAMMEGGICRKWEPGGGISKKGSLEGTLGLGSVKCMEIGLERVGFGSGLDGEVRLEWVLRGAQGSQKLEDLEGGPLGKVGVFTEREDPEQG